MTHNSGTTEFEPLIAADVIGNLLVEGKQITAEQLRRARRIQDRLPTPTSLVSVLEELRIASPERVRATLKGKNINVPLGSLLFELGYIRDAALKMALSIQRERPSQKIGAIFLETNSLTPEQLVEALSTQLGIERLDPRSATADPELWREAKWLRKNELFPIARRGNSVTVAFADPLNPKQIQEAKKVFGKDLVVGIASSKEIDEAIGRTSIQKPGTVAVGDNVVVETVNKMLNDAIASSTSDIHIEPQKTQLQIRFRQDGVLVNYQTLPLEMATPLATRLKVMGKIDIVEKRRHQDGRFTFQDNGLTADLRMSTFVSVHGESIVLRLLSRHSHLLDIRQLGMGSRMLQGFMDGALDAPSGVVIITGPTGSGKTTTLYSAINHVNQPNTSIITAEDPVEYVVDGVTQCSINARIGLTYEDTLKHIVRQDPDVIVIGEIRDTFSAETAIQAALTGHKVLTTFHTEDSVGGLVRLLNMNIEAFLVSSTVVSVLAQRLVRKVCAYCSEDEQLATHQLVRLGYDPKDMSGLSFKAARGCSECNFLGYDGRMAVFELLVLNEHVKDAVLAKKSSYEIRRMSLETTGLVTLLEDAIHKATQGLTTYDEIIRQIPRVGTPRHVGEIRRLLGEV